MTIEKGYNSIEDFRKLKPIRRGKGETEAGVSKTETLVAATTHLKKCTDFCIICCMHVFACWRYGILKLIE